MVTPHPVHVSCCTVMKSPPQVPVGCRVSELTFAAGGGFESVRSVRQHAAAL